MLTFAAGLAVGGAAVWFLTHPPNAHTPNLGPLVGDDALPPVHTALATSPIGAQPDPTESAPDADARRTTPTDPSKTAAGWTTGYSGTSDR